MEKQKECKLPFCQNKVEEDIHPHLCPKHENEMMDALEEVKDGQLR